MSSRHHSSVIYLQQLRFNDYLLLVHCDHVFQLTLEIKFIAVSHISISCVPLNLNKNVNYFLLAKYGRTAVYNLKEFKVGGPGISGL